MRLLAFAAFPILTGLAAAQLSALPPCAAPCFTRGAQNSVCDLGDYYCLCTKGAQRLAEETVKCLCETEACSPADLIKVQQASNNICKAALASSSQTYTPATTLGTNACQQTGAASSGLASSNATVPTAPGSGGVLVNGTSRATAAGSASSTSAVPGAAATNVALLGYEGAMFGLAGLAMLAL